MNGDKLVNITKSLQSRSDFLYFLDQLSENISTHPQEWDNYDLPTFLSALSSWAQDSDGYYKNTHDDKVDIEDPSWCLFADMLLAAKIYE